MGRVASGGAGCSANAILSTSQRNHICCHLQRQALSYPLHGSSFTSLSPLLNDVLWIFGTHLNCCVNGDSLSSSSQLSSQSCALGSCACAPPWAALADVNAASVVDDCGQSVWLEVSDMCCGRKGDGHAFRREFLKAKKRARMHQPRYAVNL